MKNAKQALTYLIDPEDSIYAQLLSDIAFGEFVSGDRLVTTALAERYGTSVNPVREALKQLEGEGFVTFQRNSGARVARFEFETMRNVFEILSVLEPYLLDWFIEHHRPENLALLQQTINDMQALSLDQAARFRELDTLFHWEMYRHHYNSMAVDLWRRKKIMLQALHAKLPISKAKLQSTIIEHQQMLESLQQDDGAKLQHQLAQHIQTSGEYWSRLFRL
ncbi:GntR family transcriptional regulator [Gilvimarinus agarilyticus]|uniref:GntR family transcriptional regulator n=1 Tax=Gilvimarinus sp. 2_MG-2023 TaxID=3062666 RepID=UPI001C0A2215|nr:GntR family transcriptional regulator [Gilvimarinus sp. 2_MG-2023]MBU2886402.1 GntR family transcriptional regulator [Gilvimarinus agarilyticus]MDO6571081.1 GntR family transcriptional regulator [Gilvimarinus sp. 2_MG-2023]